MSFSPRHYADFDHGYATTIHKSQGASVDHTFVLASKTMDKHLAYVSMTRHKHRAQLYMAPTELRGPLWSEWMTQQHQQSRKRSGPTFH